MKESTTIGKVVDMIKHVLQEGSDQTDMEHQLFMTNMIGASRKEIELLKEVRKRKKYVRRLNLIRKLLT